MHYRITNLIILVFFTITMDSSFATPPSRQLLEDLLAASGLDTDLKIFEQSIVTSAVESAIKNNPRDETKKRLVDILLAKNLRETFQYSLLLDEVTYFLKKRVSEEDVQEALEWYRSDLGQLIVQTQATASTKEGSAAIQSEKNELLNQHDLVTMATQVDEAIGISDTMVDLQINAQKALILAGLAIVAPGKDMSELEHANWSDIKTADRDSLRQPLAQQYQVSFAYSMKQFTQEEREQYRDFMLKPSNIRIVNAILTGISKSVEIGAHNFMSKLNNDLKNPSPELQKLLSQNPTDTTSQTPTSSASNIETTSENSDW
jgi:hypothetical protein